MSDFERRYGETLFELSHAENADESFRTEMDEIYGKFQAKEDVSAFLAPINESVFTSFEDVYAGFVAGYDKAHDSLTVFVSSAFPLDETELKLIRTRLATLSGKQIYLESSVDSSLLGGIVLQFGEYEIDGSLRARLRAVKQNIV